MLDDQSELRVAFGKFSVEIGDLNDPKKNIQISPFWKKIWHLTKFSPQNNSLVLKTRMYDYFVKLWIEDKDMVVSLQGVLNCVAIA